jgi:hypothetical protein
MNEEPTVFHTILLWAGLAFSWLGGETGRVLVASGMGGMIRWLSTEQRRMRDGIISVTGGAIVGTYLWPVVLWVLRLDENPNNIAMAAFVAGTLGMSLTKIITAMVEAKIKKGGDNA